MLSTAARRLARRGGRLSALALLRPVSSSAERLASASEPAPEPVPLSKLKDQFLNATSSTYLEELEERYRSNPKSVDKSWASFFHSMDMGVSAEAVAEAYDKFERGEVSSPLTAAAISNQTIQESMRLLLMVRAFQVMGHYAAQLDPLGIDRRPAVRELDPAYYGFTEQDLDREFYLGTWNMEGFMAEDRSVRTLREILARLRETYCGSIGYEYMHIPDSERCNWLRARIETAERQEYSQEEKLRILDRLAWSEMFESFLANKYTAAKRFGLEGCEALIPGMKALIDRSADLGVDSVVIGMPHRGRLNVLANVMRKPMEQVFSEFAGRKPVKGVEGDTYMGSGDVKYHLGTSYDRPTISGKRIHLSLLANPSHLEAVNTVCMGKVRAKQYYSDDTERTANVPILLHGDGAFAGQGIVYEGLDMSGLPDYTVGGTIHLVVNNQVAFTTDPKKSRSSPYCTDVAKALACPVFHVNADDVEAVVRVCELAAEWRQTFHSDVVIDLIGYRRYGHNEIDEPMFTQPIMYQAIKRHKNALNVYQEKLLKSGSVPKDQVRHISDKVQKLLHDAFEAAKEYKPKKGDWLSSYWAGFMSPHQHSRIRNTGVPMDLLKEVGYAVTRLPEDFTPHRQIAKVYEARRHMVDSGEGVDWGMAEALAFGTLLAEGNHVRLSGQDVERGTFSHRHAVVHDQKEGTAWTPLEHVFHGQRPKQFTVSNSSLSEYGVLGFELGYSIENPNALVIWEAQFGDFANGAQIIFDQFLSSGEAKWLRQSGLTVLLPHGYDGQGPEHSSGRMERFLQMVDEDPYQLPTIDESKWFIGGHLGSQIQSTNWQIVNCTTPANYFHVLRRQLHRQFRKPLIMFAPKNLLRHPLAKSPLSDFSESAREENIQGNRFKRVIMDESSTDRSFDPPPQNDVKRMVFCSGKVYYELAAQRAKQGKQGEVALLRLEQLAPFPFDLVMREMRRFPNAEVVWCQEEPMNMGAYLHVQPRFQRSLEATGREVPLRINVASSSSGSSSSSNGNGSSPASVSGQGLRLELRDVRFSYDSSSSSRSSGGSGGSTGGGTGSGSAGGGTGSGSAGSGSLGGSGARQVLRGISLSAEPGESIAIVGPSGSGKSTMLRLLVRLYDCDAGQVLLNGVDVRELRQDSLRASVAVVPQDTVLFNDTILHNVAYGRPGASLAEVRAAASAAKLDAAIARMPEGWSTVVGERGLKLSGGEKQRVAIARAFLRQPRLLICDEATSALDTATERGIQASLRDLAAGRTSVFVAHRLSTVQACDRIYVMADGQVAEQGTHQQLMAARGIYQEMWNLQLAQQELEGHLHLTEDPEDQRQQQREGVISGAGSSSGSSSEEEGGSLRLDRPAGLQK